ncbi:DNA methyltransferase [Sphaerospermopsis torques-reginae]|uniref:site-specific DNA-methyltransferase (cytosine-N(4)-specific) n=1 Tax=Sphaerospermopsis torques-reginae ITEP-024 TaxID=984208 RepID=A0ABX8X276_9CYAN|nr:DNA methyltransferase [Sphaerospermopsis torques-reginae]QYX32805.1 site-specific DNA-methyltransferase [Sphaerospermopsis torques-reginae ITEP-024]
MFQQLSLFKDSVNNVTKSFYGNIQQSGFKYEEIDIGDITFKGGQNESVHRWYRLTPSYSPSLVRYFIELFNITKDDFVVDPFSGRGTTVIECQKHGIKALGIEINPLLQQVGNKSLIWNSDNFIIINTYLEEVCDVIKKYHNYYLEDVINIFQTRVPIIHNVFRWWKIDVLKNLIICREMMNKEKYSSVYEYIWVALNKACLDCANIHRNHPTITFDDNHQREIDVYGEISNNLKNISEDLQKLNQEQISFSQLNSIVLGNSTNNLQDIIHRPIDFVITSPPYPNRYSYVHQTRPQLHFLELLADVREATEIDLQAIGGTWGRATSILQKDLIIVPDEIKPYFCYYDELKNQNILMCNYATKYFIDIWKHMKSLKPTVSRNFQGVYVVGNSRLSDVEIFTEVILGKLFQHEGFEVDKIISFRKRGGKKRLYETAVCIRN